MHETLSKYFHSTAEDPISIKDGLVEQSERVEPTSWVSDEEDATRLDVLCDASDGDDFPDLIGAREWRPPGVPAPAVHVEGDGGVPCGDALPRVRLIRERLRQSSTIVSYRFIVLLYYSSYF